MCIGILQHLVIFGVLVCTRGFSFIDRNNDRNYKNKGNEYCLATESFEAQCLKNEVIVMTRAVYGRMRIGRCLKDEGVQGDELSALVNDPRFLGCSVNVIGLLDRKCSGRNKCIVRGMLDSDFQQLRPCHAALKSYLEADFNCVAVIEEDRSCTVSVSSTAQHIMRSSSTKLSCGTKSQPWMLEAPAGQQINVSLLDFGTRARETGNQLVDNCLQYGYIVDKAAKKNVSICGLVSERKKMIYQSTSKAIEIVLQPSSDTHNDMGDNKILIGCKAVGCSDLIPPSDMWLRRVSSKAVVGCYTSRQTWHLRCVNNAWIGIIGNCTHEMVKQFQQTTEIRSSSSTNYQVMIIILTIVVTTVICLTVISCGAVCLKRHYALTARKQFHKFEEGYNSQAFHVHSTQTKS